MKRREFWGALLWGCVLVAVPGGLGAAPPEKVIVRILLDEETLEGPQRPFGNYLLESCAAAAEELNRDSELSGRVFEFTQDYKAEAAFFLNASYSADSRFFSLTDNRTGKRTVSWHYQGPWMGVLPPLIRGGLRSLIQGFPASQPSPVQGEYLDSFEFSSPFGDTPVFEDAYASPSAVFSDGKEGLYVLATGRYYRLNAQFRLQEVLTSDLLRSRTMTGYYSSFLTAGGTMVLLPTLGQEIHYYYPESEKLETIKLPYPVSPPFSTWPDGSVMMHTQDYTQFFLVKDKSVRPLPWPQEGGIKVYGTIMSGGPEGTVWMRWTGFPAFFVYNQEGILKDIIFHHALQDNDFTSQQSFPQGLFLQGSQKGLFMDWKGKVLWTAGFQGMGYGFNYLTSLALSADGRFLFFNDSSTRKVHKFYVGAEKDKTPYERKLLAFQKLSREPQGSKSYLLEQAALYQSAGASERALSVLAEYVQAHTNDTAARDQLEDLKLSFVKRRFSLLDKEARNKLLTFGPETARFPYSQSMMGYEQFLRSRPDDEEVRSAMASLRKLYRDTEVFIDQVQNQLSVVDLQLENLFPALSGTYALRPPGKIQIKNPLGHSVTQIRAEIFIKRFMDFPSSSPVVSELKPGKALELALPLVLNQDVLNVEEDLPVQVQITLHYKTQGKEEKTERSASLMLYRKTALVWDDAAKLASFITPNEETVQRFAKRAADNDTQLGQMPQALMRALKIVESLGVYRIRYVPDPQSPMNLVLEQSSVVDTVRFPRATLMYQSGDCDDTTALLASLLEAEGVPTAILTTPGHVFLAFSTSEPVENQWLYEGSGYEVLAHEGHLWIPLETTVMEKGFTAAWREASRLVKVNKALGELGIVTVSSARKNYSPVPLPASQFQIPPPSSLQVDAGVSLSLTRLKSDLYESVMAQQKWDTGGLTGRSLVRQLVRAGIFHARFGEGEKAEEALRKGWIADPTAVNSSVNLASFYLGQQKPQNALDTLAPSYKKNPQSVSLNLLMAQSYSGLGKPAESRKHFGVVKTQAPEMAAQYSWLGGGDGGERASGAGSPAGPLLWIQPE